MVIRALLLVFFMGHSLLGSEHIYQTGNGKTFYRSAQSELIEVDIDANGDIRNPELRDNRFKKDQIDYLLPYGDEKIIIFARNRANPSVKKFFLKANLMTAEKYISNDIGTIFPQGVDFKDMAIVEDALYILTTKGLWRKDLLSSSYDSEQINVPFDWANITKIIGVGSSLILHKNNGNIYRIDTTKHPLGSVIVRIGTNWGPVLDMVSVDDKNFVINAPTFSPNPQLKNIDGSKAKDLGALVQGMAVLQKHQLFNVKGLFVIAADAQKGAINQIIGTLCQNSSLKILTYNICWECMTNSNVGTAKNLGIQCVPDGLTGRTICANNIAKTIDEIDAYYGGTASGFDFVGLQEAARWNGLLAASTSLQKMTPVSFMWGKNEFVSFFNPRKYTLKKEIQGGFVPEKRNKLNVVTHQADRPFHILIFSQNVVVINLHNGHGDAFNKMIVERRLSEALKKALSASEIKALANYRIIALGDFNDHANYFWPDQQEFKLDFVPFRYAGLATPVFLKAKPQGTCCSTTTPFTLKAANKTSDYIFDSDTKVKNFTLEVPVNYDPTAAKSDHLPVVYCY